MIERANRQQTTEIEPAINSKDNAAHIPAAALLSYGARIKNVNQDNPFNSSVNPSNIMQAQKEPLTKIPLESRSNHDYDYHF